MAGKKIVVVLPARDVAHVLARTVAEIDRALVDDVVLVDDGSRDGTGELAASLGLHVERHDRPRGRGACEKTGFRAALDRDADVVITLRADHRDTPKLIPAMAALMTSGFYDMVLASRVLGGRCQSGGMSLFAYVGHRALTLAQDVLTGLRLTDAHAGYRAVSRAVIASLPWDRNDDGVLFANQLVLQARFVGFRMAEVSCPAQRPPRARPGQAWRALAYGAGCLWSAAQYALAVWGLYHTRIFAFKPTRFGLNPEANAAP